MKTIILGVPTAMDTINESQCCLSELRRKGLQIKKVFRNATTSVIETDNCRIIFVPRNQEYRIRSLKSDICFGFTEEEQCLLNKDHKPTKYHGTFLEYLHEVEGMPRED